MDVAEDELLAAIARVLSDEAEDLVVGVGDDAAVLRPGGGDLVLTTDSLVEGTHFARRSSAPRDLGYRAIAVNLSDVAAMGAAPRYALAALALSPEIDAAWVIELLGGMRDGCAEHGCLLVGGNLARGTEISIAVTVTGEVAPGRAVTRRGARPGDAIVVTGDLGSAAAGRRLRERGPAWDDEELGAIRRAERPIARVAEGQVIARHGATAMMDISDGLGLDLSRLCDASGVGARLVIEHLPKGPCATLEEVLGGGEDYELVATIPPERLTSARRELHEQLGVPLTTIGGIVEGSGLGAVDAEGNEAPLTPNGWRHFR